MVPRHRQLSACWERHFLSRPQAVESETLGTVPSNRLHGS